MTSNPVSTKRAYKRRSTAKFDSRPRQSCLINNLLNSLSVKSLSPKKLAQECGLDVKTLESVFEERITPSYSILQALANAPSISTPIETLMRWKLLDESRGYATPKKEQQISA